MPTFLSTLKLSPNSGLVPLGTTDLFGSRLYWLNTLTFSLSVNGLTPPVIAGGRIGAQAYGSVGINQAPGVPVLAVSGDIWSRGSIGMLAASSAAGNVASMQWRRNTGAAEPSRWQLGMSGSTESGSNVGSDLFLSSQDDAGVTLWTHLGIARSTGLLHLNNTLFVGAPTGTVGILKAPNASYALDVLGSVNVSSNYYIRGVPVGSVLQVDTTFYVDWNATSGDTNGDGTVGAPFRTPSGAMKYLSKFAFANGVQVTISCAAGNYLLTQPVLVDHPQGQQIVLLGAVVATPMTGMPFADYSLNRNSPVTSSSGGNQWSNTAGQLGANAAGGVRTTARGVDWTANQTKITTHWLTRFNFSGCSGFVVVTALGGLQDVAILGDGVTMNVTGIATNRKVTSATETYGGELSLLGQICVANWTATGSIGVQIRGMSSLFGAGTLHVLNCDKGIWLSRVTASALGGSMIIQGCAQEGLLLGNVFISGTNFQISGCGTDGISLVGVCSLDAITVSGNGGHGIRIMDSNSAGKFLSGTNTVSGNYDSGVYSAGGILQGAAFNVIGNNGATYGAGIMQDGGWARLSSGQFKNNVAPLKVTSLARAFLDTGFIVTGGLITATTGSIIYVDAPGTLATDPSVTTNPVYGLSQKDGTAIVGSGNTQPISAVLANSTTLYVDPTGNDTTGNGSITRPFATPQTALNTLAGFGFLPNVILTISCAAGTYTSATPLYFQHPQGRQILLTRTSGTVILAFTATDGVIISQGAQISALTIQGNHVAAKMGVQCRGGNSVLTQVTFTNWDGGALVASGSSFVDATTINLSSSSNPVGPQVQAFQGSYIQIVAPGSGGIGAAITMLPAFNSQGEDFSVISP